MSWRCAMSVRKPTGPSNRTIGTWVFYVLGYCPAEAFTAVQKKWEPPRGCAAVCGRETDDEKLNENAVSCWERYVAERLGNDP